MGLSAAKRAEEILLKFSTQLNQLQDKAYKQQDRIASQVHDLYQKQASTLWPVPFLEAGKFASGLAVGKIWSGKEWRSLNEVLQKGVEGAANATKTSFVDTPQTQHQGEIQNSQSKQAQITSLLEALRAMAQNVDTYKQRLQQIESGAKN